jgi:transcriptional regulator with XRE-family HTH domain
MSDFADAFKKARLNSGKTFRQIVHKVGLSIGFWSDLENRKRTPPEISVVEELEKFLGVTDGHLAKLARKARAKNPSSIGHLMKLKPEMQEVLYRMEALPENEFNAILEELRKNSSDDDPFFLNSDSLKFFDREAHPFL